MDFYIAHSFVINALILIYGLFVYLAHISYLSAYRFILEHLGFNLDALKAGKKTNLKFRKMDYDKLSWDEVRRTYWFPFNCAAQGTLDIVEDQWRAEKKFQ